MDTLKKNKNTAMSIFKHIVLIWLFSILFHQGAVADNGRLKVGDKMPDITFNKVVNHEGKSIRLSNLKGKKVIIDLWNKWCSACIASFPKAEEIQNKYNDQLVILSVTYDSVEDFLDLKKRSRIIQESNLPFVLEDSILFKLFDPKSVPFIIWIDEAGTISATTMGRSLTDENVRKFLDGRSLNMDYGAIDKKSGNFYRISEKLKSLDGIKYLVSFEKEDKPVYSPSCEDFGDSILGFGIRWLDYSIGGMFAVAYQLENGINDIVTADSRLAYIIMPVDKSKIDEWHKKCMYSFQLRFLPPFKYDSRVFIKAFQLELAENLGIEARKELIERPVLILKFINVNGSICSDNVKEIKMAESTADGIFIRNNSLVSFIKQLSSWVDISEGRHLPIVNETNINCKIDIELKFTEVTLKGINDALIKHGLILEPAVRKMEGLRLLVKAD